MWRRRNVGEANVNANAGRSHDITGRFGRFPCTCCASCGDMRPAPDKYQGWGGVSLDRLFRSSSNYHFVDQPVKLTPESLPFTLSLSLTDTSADVNVALVWTDRAGPTAAEGLNNLVNDLDLVVTATGGGQTASWYGNNFYKRDASLEYPAGRGYEHLIRGGLWVGAVATAESGTA